MFVGVAYQTLVFCEEHGNAGINLAYSERYKHCESWLIQKLDI